MKKLFEFLAVVIPASFISSVAAYFVVTTSVNRIKTRPVPIPAVYPAPCEESSTFRITTNGISFRVERQEKHTMEHEWEPFITAMGYNKTVKEAEDTILWLQDKDCKKWIVATKQEEIK